MSAAVGSLATFYLTFPIAGLLHGSEVQQSGPKQLWERVPEHDDLQNLLSCIKMVKQCQLKINWSKWDGSWVGATEEIYIA